MTSLPPFDGQDPASLWTRFRDLLWYDDDLGFWLDVSRMALSQPDFDQLTPGFERAFAAMAALEAGAIANGDEQRQVGHYWLRAPELAPDAATADHIRLEVERIDAFAQALLAGEIRAPGGAAFTDVLWIGIGGSGLGPLLMVRALQKQDTGLPFHFIDNVDPQGISVVLGGLGERLRSTLVVVVSKSGGTPEPHLGMAQARLRLEAAGGTWAAQAVAVFTASTGLPSSASSCSTSGEQSRLVPTCTSACTSGPSTARKLSRISAALIAINPPLQSPRSRRRAPARRPAASAPGCRPDAPR